MMQTKEQRLEERITLLIIQQRALPNPQKVDKIKEYSKRYLQLTGDSYKFPYDK